MLIFDLIYLIMHTTQQVFTRLGKLVDNETYRSATSLNLLIYDYLLTVLMTATLEVYGLHTTQPAFTCSKLAIETLEQRFEIYLKLTIKTPKRRHRGTASLTLFLSLRFTYFVPKVNGNLVMRLGLKARPSN